MKLTLTFLLMAIGASLIFAQSPEWIDFNKRQQLYPTNEYLIGYSQESSVKKNDLQISYEYIEQLARGELIESVQVLVNSVSSSETADYNGEYSDFFKNNTISSSSANLVGLKTDRFYDKKKKTTHIIVFVKRIDLVNYYLSLVNKNVSTLNQKIAEGDQSLGELDYKNAFKAYYSTHDIFLSIDESQTYLLALGERNSSRLKTEEVNGLKTKVQSKLNQLNQNENKTVDDVSYFVAYALSNAAIPKKDSVQVTQFGYQETNLTSKLSYRLQQNIIQDLGAHSNYSIQKGTSFNAQYTVKGTYWEKGEMLLVKTELFDQKNKTAVKSFNTSIAKNQLTKGMSYLSTDIINIRQIPFLHISSINSQLTGKAGFALLSDLKVKVTVKNQDGVEKPAYNVPVRFVDNSNNIVYGTSWTDKYGNAKFKVQRIKNANKNQVIVAELDLDNYLKVDKDNSYLTKVLRNSELPSANFYLTVKEALVYFDVSEKNFGNELGVPVIEPGLKKYLSDAGYRFTETESRADLIITINSDTRQGGEMSGLYFSYVDVNVSVKERVSNKEILKKSFNGYKGAGGSFEQAGSKSYHKASKEVCPLIYKLLME